jgi:uncharacterized membrane protein YeiH
LAAAILDRIAVFIFALTGGLVASRAQLDVVGFLFLGCLTGVGGGTLRDLVLGRDPVVPPPVFETPDCDYAARGIVSIWSRRNWAGERWPWRSISQHSL